MSAIYSGFIHHNHRPRVDTSSISIDGHDCVLHLLCANPKSACETNSPPALCTRLPAHLHVHSCERQLCISDCATLVAAEFRRRTTHRVDLSEMIKNCTSFSACSLIYLANLDTFVGSSAASTYPWSALILKIAAGFKRWAAPVS